MIRYHYFVALVTPRLWKNQPLGRGGNPRRRTAAADEETNEGLSPATDQMSHRSCLSMQTDQGCCNTLNNDERELEPFSIALFAYLVCINT
jgi:hypothetical protein